MLIQNLQDIQAKLGSGGIYVIAGASHAESDDFTANATIEEGSNDAAVRPYESAKMRRLDLKKWDFRFFQRWIFMTRVRWRE